MLRREPNARDLFDILVREHADMVVAYLRSLVGRDPIVDDLFQETMMVAWRRLKDYDRSRPLGPWLRGIARHLALEHSRRSRARPHTTDPDVLDLIEQRFERHADRAGDSFGDLAETLVDCLMRLPEAMRRVIVLVYERNLSLSAVATHTGESKDAVMKRVQRARQLLAECIETNEDRR